MTHDEQQRAVGTLLDQLCEAMEEAKMAWAYAQQLYDRDDRDGTMEEAMHYADNATRKMREALDTWPHTEEA